MQLDIKQLVQVLGQFLLSCVLLAWEQSFSLPFLFFVATLISVRSHSRGYRELLLVLLSIAFAGLYNIWFGVGIIWLFGLMGISFAVGQWLPALRVRILLTSLLSAVVVSQVMGIELTWQKLALVSISMLLFIVYSFIVRWDVRPVPIPKASWGWQSR